MIRKVVVACAMAALAATAADAVEVKLINSGKMTWNIFDSGYWIEYEIDGKRFRSDTAGWRINQIAWENMSLEDSTKVIEAYGSGGGNARIEQFGTDGAQKIADKVNDDTGWTEAWNAFADRLSKRDFPTLLSDLRAVDPAGCHGPEVGRDLASSLLKQISGVGGVASVEQDSFQTAIDMDESRVQGYVEARALKKEYAVKFAAERAEILASVQLAVIE